MAAIKSKDTIPELRLRRALWRRGHRYRVHVASLTGCPDVVFPKQRTAVFVDGDFWHGRVFKESGKKALVSQFKVRRGWWAEKIMKNVSRDDFVNADLISRGWTVLRIWESDVRCDLDRAVDRVDAALRKAGAER